MGVEEKSVIAPKLEARYTNLVNYWTDGNDVVLDFGFNLQGPDVSNHKESDLHTRIVMNVVFLEKLGFLIEQVKAVRDTSRQQASSKQETVK
jgi:hypothetical protein